MKFAAHKYHITDEAIVTIGEVETYIADSREQAVQQCLYTRRLANGKSAIGPTGYTVISGGYGWAIVQVE